MGFASTRTVVVVLAMVLAGCASRPAAAPEQAAGADCPKDWRALGEAEGRDGARRGVLAQHLAVCPTVDARLARAAFLEGHAEGRAAFCTTARQFRLGRAGKAWRGGCPVTAEAGLRAAHADGARLHSEAEALAEQRARLADIEQYARVGALQPRDRERFGDPPVGERESLRAAERALHEAEARLSRRHGADASASQPRTQ